MAQEIHVGDVGTHFIATIYDGDEVVSLGSATDLELIFRKPDGTVVSKTAELFTDGTDGKIRYTAEEGFVDQAGTWRVQGLATVDEWTGHSDIHSFTVGRNLE